MGKEGNRVILEDGEQGILSTGDMSIFDSDDMCVECCGEFSYVFTDNGFIAGGQGGAFRSYTDPSEVVNSPWVAVAPVGGAAYPQAFGWRLNWETSYNCPGGSNNNVQKATLTVTFEPKTTGILSMSAAGVAEMRNSGMEAMVTKLNGGTVLMASSAGGGGGCGNNAPVVFSGSSVWTQTFNSGTKYTIFMDMTTVDELFHDSGCYYVFRMSDMR